MQFPERDFTNQYISSSYQNVLQKYEPSNILYVLDGIGNVIFSIPSASVGMSIITSDVTSSMTVLSSSYASSSGQSIWAESTDFAVLAGEAIHATTAQYYTAISHSLITGSITLVGTESILYVSASSPLVLTLPPANNVPAQMFIIKKIDRSNNSIFITGSNNIEFDTIYTMTQSGSVVKIHSDSIQYWIL